ncbi:hypothetical protein IMSHALPRED_005164 [Imshaugia aleurites]|uniref:Uncharacterized protein n=1 Tax=Imshaugia aleurites TaxID=172621 RepID=A0A8H3IJR3_9LECA|nr:hypothetical protein IMSHALPRED_005164 [Imshaugia aleurites]
MASASDSAVFLIVHREKNGHQFRVFSYEDEEAKYIMVATNICRQLLKHGQSRQAFKEIAEVYKEHHPNGWFKKWTLDEIVNKFINLILDTFPWIFSDHGFRNPNISGCHWRRKYDGFHSRKQAILLNGSRVSDMCAAAKNAKGTNPNSKEHKYYRLFVFLIATTLFHELGHIFITFLSLGDADTPPEHVPELAGIHARTEPESGNILEGKVFGGSVVHGRDPKSDDTQPGVPHLVDKDGVGEISQQMVDGFLRCDFQFPFQKSDHAISDPLEVIGGFWDEFLPSDPLNHPSMRELAEEFPENPFDFTQLDDLEPSVRVLPKVQVGPGSALARGAFKPNDFRIEVVKTK